MNSAPRTPARALPAFWFPLAAAAVYTVLFLIVTRVPAATRPGPLASGILADLVVTVPVLWYLLVVRGRGVAVQTLIPVVIASLVIARSALPVAIRPPRLGVELALGLAETAAIAVLVVGVRRAIRAARADRSAETGAAVLPERLADVGRHAFGSRVLAEILAFELATFAYAFAGWRMKTPRDASAFSVHRESGWSMAAVGLGLLLLVEGFPVHVLVSRWNPVAGWLMTASSAYALVWLLGDAQALRLRPTRVSADALLVRLGLRCRLEIAWSDLRSVRAAKPDEPRRRRGTLRAVPFGEPGLVLDLARPLRARGFYGLPATVERVAIAPDDRRAFLAAIAAHAPGVLDPSADRLLAPGARAAGPRS